MIHQGILLLLTIFESFFMSNNQSKTVQYNCQSNKKIEAVYKEKEVTLNLKDKRHLTLKQTLTASGIRFTNSNESIVFWSKGKTAFIEENGKMIYKNCNESSIIWGCLR